MKNPFGFFSGHSRRVLGTLFLAATMGSEETVAGLAHHEALFDHPHTTDVEEKLVRRKELEEADATKRGLRDYGGRGYTSMIHIPQPAKNLGIIFTLPQNFT